MNVFKKLKYLVSRGILEENDLDELKELGGVEPAEETEPKEEPAAEEPVAEEPKEETPVEEEKVESEPEAAEPVEETPEEPVEKVEEVKEPEVEPEPTEEMPEQVDEVAPETPVEEANENLEEAAVDEVSKEQVLVDRVDELVKTNEALAARIAALEELIAAKPEEHAEDVGISGSGYIGNATPTDAKHEAIMNAHGRRL